jgi:hypothetical protein
MVALVPASADTDNQAVPFNVTLLTVPDFAGAKPVDDADQAVDDASLRSGKTASSRNMASSPRRSASSPFRPTPSSNDVTAFYEADMATGGWQPKQSTTQTDAARSTATWREDNSRFIVSMVPASADTNNPPRLVTFALELPASGSATVEATPVPAQ